ncbi:MAG: hypothetical protein COW75_12265 [Rhodobacterales bacterium CG18_big_fil_WC_8_21_14_2_50_71_9]|nr:MAG: hypothetical protein COW75_12265 [Rhodobacterales bacterium CG18_big_fil_WC_8_21_14_2_50_71_9]PJA59275.1 MAG: hypothetical protein CO163_10245 [Rhodobacterales bacterium CG_4_9_14_3_um_filter_71_31]
MLKQAMGAAAMVVALWATQGAAQNTFQSASVQRDWSVFQSGDGGARVCWIVSKPTKTEARRGAARVQVNRGDIYLMVAARPGQGVKNEVSTVIGYTFRPDSKVRLDIGSGTFELFTDGDKAWPENAAADDQIVAAMKRGTDAVLTGVSNRGTTTIDTYSLLGFTAALDEAQKLCS